MGPETPCTACRADAGRRDFVTKLLLASVGAWVAQACGDGNIGGVTGPVSPPPIGGGSLVITLANFPALNTVGGIARVDGGTSTPIAVARLGANSYVALSMVCPHAGFKPISIQSGGFECPNHGARFAANGTWTGGQRTNDLQQYPVVLNAGAGTLTIG